MAKKANVHTRNVIQCVQEKTATYTFGDKIAKSQPIEATFAGNNAEWHVILWLAVHAVMEVACGQYGDVVSGLVVAAKSHVYAEYQNAAAAAAVNEKPINSLKVSTWYNHHAINLYNKAKSVQSPCCSWPSEKRPV